MSTANPAETDYKQLNNRCPSCGHRKEMHSNGCRVVLGDLPTTQEDPCKCKRKFGVKKSAHI